MCWIASLLPVYVLAFVLTMVVEGFPRPLIRPSNLIVLFIVETKIISQFTTHDRLFAESSHTLGPLVFKLLGA